jgi:hypothetical protein
LKNVLLGWNPRVDTHTWTVEAVVVVVSGRPDDSDAFVPADVDSFGLASVL